MKRNNILVIGGLVLLGMTAGCTSDADFLKEKTKSIYTIENAYDNSDQVLATLLSAYYEYQAFFYCTDWDAGIGFNRFAGTDIADGNDQVVHYSDFTSYWSTNADFVKNMWDKYYKIISYCNLALDQVANVTWNNDVQRDRIVAEAHFLRGLSYLRLAEYFGGVPLVSEYSEMPKFDYIRASRTETYQYAIDELLLGYGGLPHDVTADYGRAGKGAAALYLSEAFLALGVEANNVVYYDGKTCYENAEFFAKDVISMHPLMQNRFGVRLSGATGSTNGIPNAFPQGNVFSDLFVSANVIDPANTETIWVMVTAPNYATYMATGGYRNSSIAYVPAVQDINWAAQYKENGAGEGPWKSVSLKYGGKVSPTIHGAYSWGLSPLTWFTSYDLWNEENNNNSPDDYRYVEGVTVRTKYLVTDEKHSLYETYVGWEHIDKEDMNTASKFFPIFYKEIPFDDWDYDLSDPGGFSGQIGNNYRNKYGARSSEAYLLLAEAYYRDNKTGEALDALNTVRIRANATPMAQIDIQVILDERARELLFEEDRWATFLRMKPDEWKSRIYDYGMYSARPGDKVYPEVRRWNYYQDEIRFTLWPIPQNYRELNTGADFPQNEGWN